MADAMSKEEFAAFISKWVKEHEQEMTSTLLELLAIPSVGTEPVDDKPFGTEVDRALKYVLKKGEEFGLRGKNVDGYAIHCEWGQGKELVMALSHVDVVPIGSGWTMNPLGQIDSGKIYGRGAQDNKGPTVASLYALRALKESGVSLKRRVRHVVGGNEESGFRCVRHYFEVEETPLYGFSPDAYFPLVYAEKGSMSVKVTVTIDSTGSKNAVRIVDFYGGERANIVPGSARITLSVPTGEEEKVVEVLKRASQNVREKLEGSGPLSFDYSIEPGRVTVTATGKACHASTPWEGRNAIAALAHLVSMSEIGLEGKEGLAFLARASEIYGEGLCINVEDDITGKLTCNLGLMRVAVENGKTTLAGTYNIRFPVKADVEDLKRRAENCARSHGVKVEVVSAGTAHYADPNSFLVKTLLDVYREETSDNSPPITMGGGTYAKVIPGGVAYGPVRPGQPETAHQPDEYLLLEDLYLMTRIYAKAFYALST